MDILNRINIVIFELQKLKVKLLIKILQNFNFIDLLFIIN